MVNMEVRTTEDFSVIQTFDRLGYKITEEITFGNTVIMKYYYKSGILNFEDVYTGKNRKFSIRTEYNESGEMVSCGLYKHRGLVSNILYSGYVDYKVGNWSRPTDE